MVQKQLTEFIGKGVIHIPFIKTISSLNLRMGRGEARVLDEPIDFKCTVCKKKRLLGLKSSVLVRLLVHNGKKEEELVLCDACSDVLTELFRFGPRVIAEAYRWELSSRVARVSIVHDDLFCFKCMGRADSHMFVKFDDVRNSHHSKSCEYDTIRVCSRCVYGYMRMLIESKVTRKNILKECALKECVSKRAWKSKSIIGVLDAE